MACMNKSLYRKSMGKKKKEMDNLAKDAAAALAAGMSYGRWKAIHGNTAVIEKKEEIPESWKACPRCGNLFKPKGRQIYCNIDCQKAEQNQRYKKTEKYKDYYRNYMARKREEGKLRNESCT